MTLNRSIVSLFLLALAGCPGSEQTPVKLSPDKPVVYTVNYPLQYFAERIGGGLVEVRFPAPTGEDPAYWEPSAEIIQDYQQAGLILLNGAGYAKWAAKATLPESRMVDTSASFRNRLIGIEEISTHTHGPQGEHAHGGTAFTTWLDPSLAAAQAEAVARAIGQILPDADISKNLAGLKGGLEVLDAAMKDATRSYEGAPLLGSHPVYQYLARAYGLNLRQMRWEPNAMPPPAEWRNLDRLLQEHAARWMIWEAPPSPAVASELERRGVRCAVFHTIGNRPESGDYLTVMSENIERIRPVFQ